MILARYNVCTRIEAVMVDVFEAHNIMLYNETYIHKADTC